MQRSRRRGGDQEGAVAIMAAVLAVAMLLAGALSVDVGRVAYTSRDQQGATDRAALDGVRLVGELRPDTVQDLSGLLSVVHTGAVESLVRNPEAGTSHDRLLYRVDLGRASSDDPTAFDLECGGYFDAGGSTSRSDLVGAGVIDDDEPADGTPPPTCGATLLENVHVNSVRLWTFGRVAYVLAVGASGTELHKTAFARNPLEPPDGDCPDPDECEEERRIAGITVRTRLLELVPSLTDESDDAELVNQVLTGLLGGDPEVTLVGYDGLANVDLPLGFLGGADVTFGTVDEILEAEVNVAEMLSAAVTALEQEDSAAHTEVITTLGTLQSTVRSDLSFRMGELFQLTTQDPGAVADARFNLLDLLIGSLLAADGNNAIGLDLDGGSDLLGLDGLLEVETTLHVIEPPQSAVGRARYLDAEGRWETWAETAQVRLDVTVTMQRDKAEDILGPTLTGLLEDVLCLLPLLCPSTTVAELSVTTAEGRADLTDIECAADPAGAGVTTLATSDTLHVTADGDTEVYREPTTEELVIEGIPGTARMTGTTPEFDVPLLAGLLDPVIGVLGLEAGTLEVVSDYVQCDRRQVMPLESD